MTYPPTLPAFRRRLAPDARRLLAAAVAHARAQGLPLYAVGGALRDLAHPDAHPSAARPPLDLDLALDGPVAFFARDIARTLHARCTIHPRFETATVALPGAHLDLARTRMERYARPGALPTVLPADIHADLARRDFSVNALALGLAGPDAGRLLDPFAGLADLDRRLIRILADRSFQDDPTRLFRACRYAARLDGRLAPATARAFRRDLSFLDRLSGPRRGAALRGLLTDRAAPAALERAARWGLLRAIDPACALPPRSRRAFAAAPPPERPLAFWALAGLRGPDAAARTRLRPLLTRQEGEALTAGMRLAALRPALARPRLASPLLASTALSPSRAAATLRPLPEAALRAAALAWPHGRASRRLRRFLDHDRHIGAPLDAAALRALAVPPGPALGRWLAVLRNARLDGTLPAGRAGVGRARRWVESAPDAPPPSLAEKGSGR